MSKAQVMYKGRLIPLEKLMELLKKEFAKHIGEEYSITMIELLKKYFEDYEEWSVWKKYTYVDIVRKCISVIRRQGEVFIINKNGKYFVIKIQEEANYYKNILKKDIEGMNKSIVKADEWIRLQKWKKL